MDESRRQFLKMGAGLVGAGAMTGLAGCSQVPFLGGGGGGGPAFYKNWMYAPDTFVDQNHYGFTAYRPSNWAANEDNFDGDYYDNTVSSVESQFEMTGLDFEDINQYVALNGQTATVIQGSYNKEDVVGEVEDADGWEEEEQLDSGMVVFVNSGSRSAVGVGSNAIIKLNRLPQGISGQGVDLSAPASDEAQQDARSISYGDTITGTIDDSDPSGRRGNYEPVTFSGSSGDVVTITMAGNDDTYLQLLDPDGNEVIRDDDGYSGLNSQIQRYTLESSGEYTIVATSYSSMDTFAYRLQLDLVFSPSEFPETISTIAATQGGDTALYGEEVDAASTLFSTLGGGDFVSGRTMEAVSSDNPEQGQFENMTAQGTAIVVNGQNSSFRSVVVYEDADDYDQGDLEDWTGEASQWDDVDNISYSQNGNAGVITGQIATDDIGN